MSWFGYTTTDALTNKNKHSVQHPSCWKKPKSSLSLSTDGLVVTNKRTKEKKYAVQSNYPLVRNNCNVLPYFEIFIQELEPQGVVAVGLATDKFACEGVLPGWVQNSYGYHSDDGNVFHNRGDLGIPFGPKFGKGSTVGCGLMTDDFNQTRVFFTLNGKFLGCVFDQVPVGMDCFPTVGVECPCVIKANFGQEPFKFNVQSIPLVPKTRPINHFDSLPNEIVLRILDFASSSAAVNCLQLSLTCKKFKQLASHNDIWKRLYYEAFPTQSKRLKVKDWKNFYKVRHVAIREQGKDRSHPIENCGFEFKCPLLFEELELTPDKDIKFCKKCNQNVYMVYTKEQLEQYVSLGRCVAFEVRPKESSQLPTAEEPEIVMGDVWYYES